MYVMIGLSMATGIPWEYWAGQDDEVVATALSILQKTRGGKVKGTGTPHERAPQMSG